MLNNIQLPLLDRVQIASPCSADWDAMAGNERKRFCQQCSLHVYNIADMTRDEAEDFLQMELAAGKRTCARIFRREDGTVLTKDCPTGLHRIRLRAVRAAAACVAFMFGGLAMAAAGTRLGHWAEAQNAALLVLPPAPIGAAGGLCMPSPPGNPGVAPGNLPAETSDPTHSAELMGDVAFPSESLPAEFRGQIAVPMGEDVQR